MGVEPRLDFHQPIAIIASWRGPGLVQILRHKLELCASECLAQLLSIQMKCPRRTNDIQWLKLFVQREKIVSCRRMKNLLPNGVRINGLIAGEHREHLTSIKRAMNAQDIVDV